MTTKRGRYSEELKLETIKLVEELDKQISDVVSSLSIDKTTLENQVYKYRKERKSIMLTKDKALMPELRCIQELEKQVKQLKLQHEISNEKG